jgi:hypothetical protein
MCAAFATAIVSAPAHAQDARANSAAAEVLFNDAQKLMDDGKAAEACPKFAESYRLDPGVGVLLYLGDCYEKIGKVASAWAAYREAIPAAKAQGHAAREKAATERADALQARLPKIVVSVAPAARVDGLVVSRDGTAINEPLWGSAVPVDPGPHTIDASAPGRKRWTLTVDATEGTLSTVELPPLELEAARIAPSAWPPPTAAEARRTQPPPPDQGPGWPTQRKLALAAGAVGAAGLVVGGVFGAKAMTAWDDAKGRCDAGSPRACDPDGVSLAGDASTFATVSTIGFVAGGALLGLGVVLWVSAPSAKRAVGLAPTADTRTAGLVLRGTL